LKNLAKIVDDKKIYPIQTDSRRCGFGHFYNSIDITHPDIAADWRAIDSVHENFHRTGAAVLEAIKANDEAEARGRLAQAQALSQQIFALLDKTIAAIERNSRLGIEVMRTTAD
jgi:hypothetical protein